ncbi:MAG: divalent-cation tolerance protein CutA [Cyanobacteria bacterium K_DeepCast_35m_m2_023]|nr:divalent-cation tolerance protein CutA [Cyanobacteria bacterium K_DeepCast_35m_m2_023]
MAHELPQIPAAAVIVAVTTEASPGQAEALARALLDRRLVACVSLRPLQSLYLWQGRLEQADEVQLLLKSDAARLAALQQAVHALHSYETPEWLWWPVSASAAYGGWLQAVLNPDAGAAVPSDRSGGVDPTG